jgi:DNA-binding NarL/FixJ family response regulator
MTDSDQRVLIFGDSIFEEGIANLLSDEADLQVSSAKYKDDRAFLAEIAEQRPDVLVLNESTPQNTVRILKLLFSIPELTGLRVVIVRLSDNMIDVYEMPKQAVEGDDYKLKQINATKSEKLAKAVRG